MSVRCRKSPARWRARAWRVRSAARSSIVRARLCSHRERARRGNPGGGDHQASERSVIGEGEHGRWCHLLWKSACFSMCAGSAYWCHLSAKSFAISTNGTNRSESRWQVPVRLGAQCLTQSDASAPPAESLPAPKIFLQKRLSHKGYPLYAGRTIFGQVFGRGAGD